MKKHLLAFGIIFLFLSSVVAPMTMGIKSETLDYDVDPLRDYYGCYNLMEIPESIRPIISEDEEVQDIPKTDDIVNSKESLEPLIGPPMDSAWPMCSHDVRHTGRSPYITSSNNGLLKWKFEIYGPVWGGAVIDENGIIYIGTDRLYALYPNGTLKWRYEERFRVYSTPAIDENGIIYIGSIWAHPNYLYAIYSNNGTLKWKFKTDNHIFSSPAIGDDGSIYFGSEDEKIYALYPNGTLKWKYKTDYVVLSSPAIGNDGTIYCGSHDTYLYALYPNNGTLRWKYKTGHWVRVSPCIGDDGTIYCVSLDDRLHAVYPNNGTMKWKTSVGAGTSPTIGQDGTIYCGYSKLHAVNPTDGSKKWSFDVQGKIRGGTPCNSIDGTIYLGNSDGSDIVAVNPDGTEKWRKSIGGDVESAPCIGEDGTVYIGDGTDDGHFYAFGYPGPNPLKPTISGPSSGKPGVPYIYKFTSIDPEEDHVSYYIEWGDGTTTGWTGYQPSGETCTKIHTWTTHGTYIVRAKAKDNHGYESDWGTLSVAMPRDKATNNMLIWRLFEQFPLSRGVFLS
jgi:outer membrane protein assembly factor BamB